MGNPPTTNTFTKPEGLGSFQSCEKPGRADMEEPKSNIPSLSSLDLGTMDRVNYPHWPPCRSQEAIHKALLLLTLTSVCR